MKSKITVYGPNITYQYSDEGALDSSLGGGCNVQIPAESITCPKDIREIWQTEFLARWINSNKSSITLLGRLQELMKHQLERLPDNPFVECKAYLAGVTNDPGEYVLGWVKLAKEMIMEEMEEEKRRQQKQREIEESRHGITCYVIKQIKGYGGEGGVDPSALVEITIDEKSQLRFNCRNIFDFGYVVNPDYEIAPGLGKGGLYNQGMWQGFDEDKGWYNIRKATPDEERALRYLYLNPPIYDGIRM